MMFIINNCEIQKFIILVISVISITLKTTKSCKTPSFEQGACVDPSECQFIIDIYQKYGKDIPDYFLDYIKRSKCSKDNESVRLCCSLKKIIKKTHIEPIEKITYVPDLNYNREYLSQLNPYGLEILNKQNCGEPNGNRISGGNVTQLNEFPWLALLRYNSKTNGAFNCGGTLITQKYILTAAHCVHSPSNVVVSIRLGEYDLNEKVDCEPSTRWMNCAPPVEDYEIRRIIVHDKYNARRKINDIALIELNREVTFKKHIKPICLPITSESIIMYDKQYLIAGWGFTEYGPQSSVLLKASINILDGFYCEDLFRLEVTEKHICAGDLVHGRDTCKGDSGGPFFQLAPYQNAKKKYIQYGIVSYGGISCNLQQKLPGLYVNIITYMPWITFYVQAI